jgi:hypothetical protein
MPPPSRSMRVFIGWGDQESPDTIGPMRRLSQALSDPRRGLQVREMEFPGQNHVSSFLFEGPNGLPFLLPP